MSEHDNGSRGPHNGFTPASSGRPKRSPAIAARRGFTRGLTAAACITVLMLSTTAPAFAAGGGDPVSVVVDVVLARPISAVLTVGGTALFVVSWPIAAASHSVDTTSETLVCAPARDLLKRPVGDLSEWLSY